MEPEKRHKLNIDNLPPRFRKKFLGETAATPEENWDGCSLTFQGHRDAGSNLNNPSFHQMGAPYNTLPPNQNLHNQVNPGYYTLPNKPRGRGRLQQEYENPPGQMFRSITPDRIRSPCNSRPPTPPSSGNRRPDSRPHTPVSISNEYQDNRSYQDRYNKNVQEDRSKNLSDQLNTMRQKESRAISSKGREYDNRRHGDFNRDGGNYKGDNRRGEDGRGRGRIQDSYKRDKETPNRETPSRDNRKNRDTPSRDNRRDGGNSHRDRRRDNRRDRDKRSKSRDYSRTPTNVNTASSGPEENWFVDEENNDKNGMTPAKNRLRPSLEAQLSPVSPDTPEEVPTPINLQIVGTLLVSFALWSIIFYFNKTQNILI